MASKPTTSLLTKMEVLKQKIPDARLHQLVDNLVKMKRVQALTLINHKLYPKKLEMSSSELVSADRTEGSVEDTLKRLRRNINTHLNKLWRGAKYE